MLENIFTKFIKIGFKISDVYSFKGKFDEAMLFFDLIKPILDLKDLKKEIELKIKDLLKKE